jgi:glycosyltransferase involved in cell wall biosynthesis
MALEAVSILSRTRKIRLWMHVDSLERHWSIPALLVDFGLIDKTVVSLGYISDDNLAKAYSSCDLTLGIAPEGFGYIHVESLACGTPCIVGSYAGGAELVSPSMRIKPVAFRYESIWACKRPVYDPADWAARASKWIGQRATMDRKYDWNQNWAGWENWFREGVK